MTQEEQMAEMVNTLMNSPRFVSEIRRRLEIDRINQTLISHESKIKTLEDRYNNFPVNNN